MRPRIGIPCYTDRGPRSNAVRFCMGSSYCRAVGQAQGIPWLIPLLQDEGIAADIMSSIDGLLLAGGGDVDPLRFGEERRSYSTGMDPARDGVELELTRRALDSGHPILAVCRGIQVLNVACGGTLHQDIGTEIAGAQRHSFRRGHARNYLGHTVDVRPATRLAAILGSGSIAVNSFHHQAIKVLGTGLQVTAVALDGVIEGVESSNHRFVLGVQWHPEELVDDDPRMAALFAAFVSASCGRT
jgi:putative glutamine amidotransferase